MMPTMSKPKKLFTSPYHAQSTFKVESNEATDKSSYSYPDGNNYDRDEHAEVHAASKDLVDNLEHHEKMILHKNLCDSIAAGKDPGEPKEENVDLNDMTPEEQEPEAE